MKNKQENFGQGTDPKEDPLNDQANSEAELPQTKIDDKSDYDGGYKHELSNKAHFLHFLKKYVKADWAMDLNTIEPADLRSGNSILDYILLLDKDKKKRSVINILSAAKEQIGSFSTSDKTGFIKWLQYVLLPAMGDEYKEQALQIIAAMEGDGKKMIHHIQVVQQEEYQRYWDDGVAHGIKQGHATGLNEGLSEGLSLGQERINRLNEYLIKDNRQDDLLRSVNDPVFQNELMREYGLEKEHT
ncbi:MAG: hypothetical protein LBM69_05675 [Lachnospiraceae bacterium]|nr:hypothetical protein [Lachnospiraceae bacterium]